MITGDTISQTVYLQTLAGVGLSYANKTAFTTATWALTWVDSSGVALTTQPTWSIAHVSGSTNGQHIVTFTVPAGFSSTVFTVPAADTDPGSWSTEGESYDADSLAGLFLTTAGVPTTTSAADGDLGDVVTGDSWNSGTLYIPLGKLTALGYSYSDLASGWTITAGFKTQPSDTMVTATATLGATAATDGAFSFGWVTFPAGMVLASPGQSQQWYVDIQLKRTASSTIITSNRYALNVVWERNTTT